MRFFVTEEDRKRSGSSEYIEFQKGRYDGECWHIDSISMPEQTFYDMKLRRFFSSILPQFDYYGLTQVTSSEFEKLKAEASSFSHEAAECMNELSDWIGDSADNDVVFTICGM